MKIGTLRETYSGEALVAMTPGSAVQLGKLGYACFIETCAGLPAGISDYAYRAVGVTVVDDAAALVATSDVIVRGAALTEFETQVSCWPEFHASIEKATSRQVEMT